jgi:hypothetical protein
MNDPTELGTERPGSRRPASHSRWRRPLRWFFSEFLVVVTGVIVALALNAWWQDREDAKRELIYLKELSADLKTSDPDLEKARQYFTDAAHASATVCHEIWHRDAMSDDALYEQMVLPMRSMRVLPILGTARGLIASGDLRLLHSIELRSAIVSYVDAVDARVADIVRYDETYYREGIHAVSARMDIYALFNSKAYDPSLRVRPDETSPAPFPVKVSEALKDRAIYTGYQMLLTGHRGQAVRYTEIQEKTRTLLEQVNATLAKMGG